MWLQSTCILLDFIIIIAPRHTWSSNIYFWPDGVCRSTLFPIHFRNQKLGFRIHFWCSFCSCWSFVAFQVHRPLLPGRFYQRRTFSLPSSDTHANSFSYSLSLALSHSLFPWLDITKLDVKFPSILTFVFSSRQTLTLFVLIFLTIWHFEFSKIYYLMAGGGDRFIKFSRFHVCMFTHSLLVIIEFDAWFPF